MSLVPDYLKHNLADSRPDAIEGLYHASSRRVASSRCGPDAVHILCRMPCRGYTQIHGLLHLYLLIVSLLAYLVHRITHFTILIIVIVTGAMTTNGTVAHAPSEPQPLKILIVGAGIGGLTAAIALRNQGHDVQIFEQSQLATETGAAIHLAPNANGLLRRLGIFAEQFGANLMERVRLLH